MSDEIDMRDASSADEDDLNDEALEVISEFTVIVSLRLKTRIRRNFGNYANADFSSLFRSLDAVSASVPVAGPGQLPASGGQAGRDLYRGEYRGPWSAIKGKGKWLKKGRDAVNIHDFYCRPKTALARGPEKTPMESRQRSRRSLIAPNSSPVVKRLFFGGQPFWPRPPSVPSLQRGCCV